MLNEVTTNVWQNPSFFLKKIKIFLKFHKSYLISKIGIISYFFYGLVFLFTKSSFRTSIYNNC